MKKTMSSTLIRTFKKIHIVETIMEFWFILLAQMMGFSVMGEYIPDLRSAKWSHASTHDIICPTYSGVTKPSGSQVGTYSIYKPDLSKELTKAGYFCHVGDWSTKCSTGFWGGVTVSHEIHPGQPSLQECYDAAEKHFRGDLVNRGFPPPGCGWMSTNTEVQRVITIKEHRAYYDPVLDTTMDIMFVPTKCNAPSCETTHADTIWLRDTTQTQYCFHDITGRLNLYHDGHEFSLESDDLSTNDLKGSCLLSYCHKEGLLLRSGEWFSIVEDSQYVVQLKRTLPQCNKQSVVKQETISRYTLDQEVVKSLAAIHRDRCEVVVRKFALNHTMTRLDLQAMTPINPGLNRVYRFGEKGIEVTMGNYRSARNMTVDPISKKLTILYFDNTNSSIWLKSRGQVFDGPNGIFWYDGVLYTTETVIDKTLSNVHSLESMDVIHSEHPLMGDFQQKAGLSDIKLSPKSLSKSLSDVIGSPSISFKHMIMEALLWICGLILGLWAIKLIMLKVCRTRSTRREPHVVFSSIKPWDPKASIITS